ncbi:hypothetical protein IMCC26134_09270 [Verrucomicrobia bacterium IMCC26134]|nr:hypothetical protein IMCC26134_09270 [Verrucomicrobia bacterium IMCC26134]
MFGINHDFSSENAPLVPLKITVENTGAMRPRFAETFMTGKEVMVLLGYRDPGSFWFFVRSQGVPHIVLNQRKIVFDRRALDAWIQRRSVGKHPPRDRW